MSIQPDDPTDALPLPADRVTVTPDSGPDQASRNEAALMRLADTMGVQTDDDPAAALAEVLAARKVPVAEVGRWFDYSHMRPGLARQVSERFTVAALSVLSLVADDPELVVSLRKMLEAKDAAVRAALRQAPNQ